MSRAPDKRPLSGSSGPVEGDAAAAASATVRVRRVARAIVAAARAWPLAIVVAVVALLPVGRSSEAPLAIGAIVAIVLLLRGRLQWNRPGAHLAIAVFACYWLPALLSCFDAVDTRKSWSTVAVTLRFLPFALFAVWAFRRARGVAVFNAAVAAIVGLWAIDAYVQMLTGHSLGGAAEAERLSGIFGAGNLKLGPVLAVLAPFPLLAARARFGRIGLVVAFALLLPPILLAGSRAAWLCYALVGVILAWRETRSLKRLAVVLVLAACSIGVVGALALHDSTRFGARIERTLLALRGSVRAVDDASAGRLSIWRTAAKMIAAHPLNGVGARDFRYAYAGFAAPNDRFVDTTTDIGASHAHQIVLEILSETGVVGLAFWLIGTGVVMRAWRRADAHARARAGAPALALVAMCFPINTHLAFYSAWWGLLFWWLLALYCAALSMREREAPVAVRLNKPPAAPADAS